MNTRYHADLPAWILFGGLSLVCLAVAYADISQSNGITLFSICLIALSLFILTWLLSFQIEVEPDRISFRSLFRGRRSIRTELIKKASLTFDFSRRTEGPWQLIVESHDRSIPDLRINAKVFPRAAIHAVLEHGTSVGRAEGAELMGGIFIPAYRGLRKNGVSTFAILIGSLALLMGAVGLVGASFHSFETILFYWQDKRRVFVELVIFGSGFLLFAIGERLLGEHQWLRSMIRQLPAYIASFGFLGVVVYVGRTYFAREPHWATTYETIWFCISLAGFALCAHRFNRGNKRKSRAS